LWSKLCEFCANVVELVNLMSTTFPDPATGKPIHHRPTNSVAYQAQHAKLERSVVAVEHELHFLADLSAVDGAIVMTDRFEVLGFGAELMVGGAPASDILVHGHDWASEPSSKRLDESGMRHRSMYKYVAANPAATGFVISQDGHIKGVNVSDNRVHVWTDLGSY
jgi:hypothetical protein